MAGELKLEILFRGSVYVLNRMDCAKLLIWLENDEPEIGSVTGTLKADLRKAIMDGSPAPEPVNPFDGDGEETGGRLGDASLPKTTGWPVTGGVVKNVAKENAEADSDEKTPLCRFCEQPGKRAGGRKDGAGRTVERYYVCKTTNCIAARIVTPQPARIFSGGAQ